MATGTNKKQDFATLPIGGKVLLLVIVLGALSGGYFFALYQPLTDEIESAQQRKTQLDTEFAEAQERQSEHGFLACHDPLKIDRFNRIDDIKSAQ